MKITHVKVCNYRNLRNIDIGLAETVAIIGENNSGKSNFLKAITLPFLTDDNTHISKKLSWSDINNETKKCYYNKIIENQNKIKNDEITIEQFVELLPIVSVEVNIQASGAEEYYVKDLSYEIRDGKIQYGIKYEFAPKSCEDIFRMVKEIVSENEINDANLNEVKMNLLPVEYYNYSVKVSDGSNISYDTLKQFKYEALEAERDDFSRTKNQLGSKFLVDLLKDGLSDQDKLKIEKEYSHFFESLKKISDINDIINWQDTSELKEAKKFFSHINILPNMPPMQSILNSVRLGYSEEELSMQGFDYKLSDDVYVDFKNWKFTYVQDRDEIRKDILRKLEAIGAKRVYIINVVSDKNYKPSAIVDQCLVEIPMLIREDGTVCYENLHMIRKEDFENVN